MPVRPCPTCLRDTPRRLPEFSRTITSEVFYYRCEHCGHVWVIPKDAPNTPPQTVMKGILPREDD